MTMPHERTRSLRWGWELLSAIAEDAEVDESIKRDAALIKATYPPPELITQLIEADVPGLPPAGAQSIGAAADLFNKLWLNRQGTEETRQHLRFTLRHFPAFTDMLLMGSQSAHFHITDWLLQEDWYDRRE